MSKKSLLKTLIREKIKKINEVYHGSHLWRSYYFVSLAFFNHKGINSKDEFIYKDLELKFSKKHFLIGEKMFFARNDVKNRKNFGHGLNAINKFINEKKLTHLENFSFKDFRFSSKEEIIKYFKNNLEYSLRRILNFNLKQILNRTSPTYHKTQQYNHKNTR